MSEHSLIKQGPHLTAALLCEKVLIEQDGVKSVVRIIDRFIRTAIGQNPPEEMPPFDVDLFLLVSLKSGRARGSHPLRIVIIKPPGGESNTVVNQTVLFEGEEDRGIDLINRMQLKIELEGIYWFEIYLHEDLLARTPLRVIYERKFTQKPQA